MKRKEFRHRSPREVFAHHGKAGERRDLEAYVSDFSPRSIIITRDRVYLGRSGLREWILEFWGQLQNARFTVLNERQVRNVIFVRYNCTAKHYCILDGVATFVVKNGYFSVLTNNYTLTPQKPKANSR